ncbi:unnamed protein product [Acidithrix sp. C25]|nr:unnamed protein product [Acidithrix sp. C25]
MAAKANPPTVKGDESVTTMSLPEFAVIITRMGVFWTTDGVVFE